MGKEEKRSEFLDVLRQNAGDEDVAVAERIVDWVQERGLRETYVPANVHGEGYCPVIPGSANDTYPFAIANGYPHVFVQGESLKKQNPFSFDEQYAELIERLYAIPQVVRTPDSIYPHLSLRALDDSATWDEFFGVMDWVVKRVKSAVSRGLS